MQKKTIYHVALMAILFLGLFSTAMGQYRYRDDKSKILFQVEGWWVTPTGMGFDVATLDENWLSNSLARGGGDILGIEMDSKFSGRYTLGYKLKESLGMFSLSYWDFSSDSSFSKTGAPDSYIIGELLAHPYYAGQGYMLSPFLYDTGRADAVQSMAKVETTFIDIDFSRNIPSQQNFSCQWSIGIRDFKYSHSFDTIYLGDPYGRVSEGGQPIDVLDTVTENIKAEGTGAKVGFSGNYMFTKNFSLYGGVNVSFIPGKTDTLYVSTNNFEGTDPAWNLPPEDLPWGPFEFKLNRQGKDSNFVIYDFDAGLRLAIAEKLSINFGYRLTNMQDVIYRMRFTPDSDIFDFHADWDAAESAQHDVSFSGLYFGLAYEF